MTDQSTWLVAGLGNPGTKYALNWHNCGYMVLEILAQRHRVPISRIQFKGLVGQARFGQNKALFLKPTTYMNSSGESIQEALAYYKIPASQCLVLYDDIDIALGQIRIRASGGSGTHNGMRSIISHLHTQDFPRIRIGIGPQPKMRDIADFVLSDVPTSQREDLWQSLNQAADAVESILKSGLEQTMSRQTRR